MSTPRSLDLDASVKAQDLPTDRGTFSALVCVPQETGLPRGSVLLLPGFTGSKEDFAALLPLLAASGWQAATYDQRGQFETPAGEGDDVSLAGFAEDAIAVASRLFPDEAVHLVGHSFGGLVATAAVLQAPSAWASLLLLCSGPGGLPADQARAAREGAELVEAEGLESAYAATLQRNRDRGLQEPPHEIEAFLHRRFLSNAGSSLAAIARHLADAPDRTGELAAVAVPVSVMRGEKDDAWPHRVQDELAEVLGTKVIVVADAGHSPAVDQPEATRDALVRTFMASR